MMEGVAARLRCWQRGLTGWNEARPRVDRHTGESQERERAGPQARAESTARAEVALPRRHRGPQIGINSFLQRLLYNCKPPCAMRIRVHTVPEATYPFFILVS